VVSKSSKKSTPPDVLVEVHPQGAVRPKRTLTVTRADGSTFLVDERTLEPANPEHVDKTTPGKKAGKKTKLDLGRVFGRRG
jgi:hypothetical protein